MNITITNTDEKTPVILRLMHREEGVEIDSLSEAQLLPGQSTDIQISQDQSLTVFAR
jgi:hypothetical protein